MNNKLSFYQTSKELNTKELIIACAICFPLAIILGYTYSLLITSIPLIYFTIVINIGMGLLIGLLTRLVSKMTHNRNKKSQFIIALVFSLMFNYFQWVTYLLYASLGQIPSITNFLLNLGLIFYLKSTFITISEINSVGLWSIFGNQFSGFSLTVVWILEILLITLLPIFSIYKAKIFPYSEAFNKWYPKYTLDEEFRSITSAVGFSENLEKNVLEAINQLNLGRANNYTKIHLYYIENEKNQYIDFEEITIDREGKTDSDILVENLKIDSTTAKKILNSFDNKKEKIEVL